MPFHSRAKSFPVALLTLLGYLQLLFAIVILVGFSEFTLAGVLYAIFSLTAFFVCHFYRTGEYDRISDQVAVRRAELGGYDPVTCRRLAPEPEQRKEVAGADSPHGEAGGEAGGE